MGERRLVPPQVVVILLLVEVDDVRIYFLLALLEAPHLLGNCEGNIEKKLN